MRAKQCISTLVFTIAKWVGSKRDDEFTMGKLSNPIPDQLLLDHIQLHILGIHSWKDQVALFFDTCLCNKIWKNSMNKIEDWFVYYVHLVEFLCDQACLEE
jgi:hypothetical protein